MHIDHYPISDFERERFSKQIEEELGFVQEIKAELDEVAREEKEFYAQRAKAIKLERSLKSKMLELKVDHQLQMVSLGLPELRNLNDSLKKRLVKEVSPKGKKEIKALQNKLNDEILQEEHGQKAGFKTFPITLSDLKLIKQNNK